MGDISRWQLLNQTYTPGTVLDQGTQNGSTGPNPPSAALSQAIPGMGLAPRVPIVGIVLVLAVLFLLEHRRIRLSRK